MRRLFQFLFWSVSPLIVAAQLSVDRPLDLGAVAGAGLGIYAPIVDLGARLGSSVTFSTFGGQSIFPGALLVDTVNDFNSSRSKFDFTKSVPHLAFFCRLEINERKGGVIPMKFRLGGHQSWQEQLLKR